MPSYRLNHSGELDVFDATLYFSGGLDLIHARRPIALDFIAAHRTVGEATIRNIHPPSLSHSPKVNKVVRDNKKSRQPSSGSAKLARFAHSIFRQTKSKPKLTHNHQAPKPLKKRSSLCPNITKIDMGYYNSCKNRINAIYLVHEAKLNKKSTTNYDEFVEYNGVPNDEADYFLKDDRIWFNGVLSSTKGRRSSRKDGDPVEPENCYFDQRHSVCSSDLFELENYNL